MADYYIDLHSGDDYEQLTPYIYYAGCADEDVVQMSRKMAEQADVPYMVKSNVASGVLTIMLPHVAFPVF